MEEPLGDFTLIFEEHSKCTERIFGPQFCGCFRAPSFLDLVHKSIVYLPHFVMRFYVRRSRPAKSFGLERRLHIWDGTHTLFAIFDKDDEYDDDHDHHTMWCWVADRSIGVPDINTQLPWHVLSRLCWSIESECKSK